MTHLTRAFVAAAALVSVLGAGAGPAAAQDFTWAGAIPQGRAIEIKGVNGDVRAEPSGSNQVEVVAVKSARRDDPASVRIQMVPHDGGVTICAVYPSRDGARPNECAPGDGGRNNVQNNDVTVRFTVRVPAGVTFIGKTVNGDIEATRLNGDVALETVNGSVTFSTTGGGRARTVNGSIRGEMGRADWSETLSMNTVNGSITLTLPATLSTDVRASTVNGEISADFPITVQGKISRRRLEGTIGGGGRTLALESVNGSITLKRE
jgi:Putative adhesin